MYTLWSLKCKLRTHLPRDEVFRQMFKPHLDQKLDFTSVELQENTVLLVTLLSNHQIVEKYDGKHFHILTILCAAWMGNLELVKTPIGPSRRTRSLYGEVDNLIENRFTKSAA